MIRTLHPVAASEGTHIDPPAEAVVVAQNFGFWGAAELATCVDAQCGALSAEPDSLALFRLGLVGLAVVRRRRAR